MSKDKKDEYNFPLKHIKSMEDCKRLAKESRSILDKTEEELEEFFKKDKKGDKK